MILIFQSLSLIPVLLWMQLVIASLIEAGRGFLSNICEQGEKERQAEVEAQHALQKKEEEVQVCCIV